MDTQARDLSEALTVKRHNDRQDRIAQNDGFGATEGALALIKINLRKFSNTISEDLSGPVDGFEYTIRNLDPDVIAYSTLRTLLHCVAMGWDVRTTLVRLGNGIAGECWAAGLLKTNPKLRKATDTYAKRRASAKARKQAATKLAKRLGYQTKNWTRTQLTQAGGWLLKRALTALPHLFELERNGKGVPSYVQILPEAMPIAQRAVEFAMRLYPVFVPCTKPVAPWTQLRTGGFWDERERFNAPFVRRLWPEHEATVAKAIANGDMRAHVSAVNAVQAVGWTINQRVLDVIEWAYEARVPIKGLPSISDTPLPSRLADDEANDADKLRAHRIRIRGLKEHNRGLKSSRVLLAQDLETARRLAAEQAFWTPYSCDWRGRLYGCTHFNFSRDDRVRALFLFANGMPIGEEGLYWLKVHVANTGDVGKISKRPFEERVAWVDQNIEALRDIAQNPYSTAMLRGPLKWTQADKPFLFLAACQELSAAVAVGPSYITRLPISFDGSCSGLQHLCAMTRAAEGSLVNLTPGEGVQDVYQTVADLVRAWVESEATEYGAGAVAYLFAKPGAIKDWRKLVKRNVMTYGYSSELFGMAQQHMEDFMRPLWLETLEGVHKQHPFASPGDYAEEIGENGQRRHYGDGHAAAVYIAGHIYDAIESVIQRPAHARAFLRKVSNALAHESKPLIWTTPTGFVLRNCYYESNVKTVDVWLADQRISYRLADGHTKRIRKQKAANGIAPNLVHALDAAHLCLTVNAAVREGINNLALVHDSFGCLAPQAPRFRQIIREQFVLMYDQHDVLAEVLDAAKRDLTVHDPRRLPEGIPEKGPLNLMEVLNAEYAFA